MADPGKVYPTEFHLLKKELEVQGELLTHERLERTTEVDQLRIELEALKHWIERLHPGAKAEFERLHAEERRSWDPELRKKTG